MNSPQSQQDEVAQEEKRAPKIETTEDELEAYFIAKNILSDVVRMKDITYKDTASYFNILYQNNTLKWICRVRINSNGITLIVPDENKKEVSYPLNDIYDINKHADMLKSILARYI